VHWFRSDCHEWIAWEVVVVWRVCAHVVQIAGDSMTKQRIVLAIGWALSLLATIAILVLVLSGSLARSDRAGDAFLIAAVVNGIALFLYLRAIRLNSQLSPRQKDHWIIAVVIGMGFGQLAYFVTHVRRA
jgi:Kef-type K+ transport system membrane component KefB